MWGGRRVLVRWEKSEVEKSEMGRSEVGVRWEEVGWGSKLLAGDGRD